MKKNLLVTLADRNWIDQAKQLFSSAYWNAGWKGDYMLLAHDIPEKDLKWFRDKGILIKKCGSLYEKKIGKWPSTVTSKFHLFKPEFKKWKTIVYLDADIIVRKPLNRLTEVKGFAAVMHGNNLASEFKKYSNKKTKDIMNEYNLREKAFNSGVMVFNTRLIKETTFDRLVNFLETHGYLCIGEEGIFNLLFYKKWKKLSEIYNYVPLFFEPYILKRPDKINAVMIHFLCYVGRPWEKKSRFYSEWSENLKKADKIDLRNLPRVEKLTLEHERKCDAENFRIYLINLPLKVINYILMFFDFLLFKIGEIIKKYFPAKYSKLKKRLNKLKRKYRKFWPKR